MESLLERGEKLDDLVAKSEHLGNQSKAFYKTVSTEQSCPRWAEPSNLWLHACVSMFTPQARKQNSCCKIMWCHCLVLVDTPHYAFLLFLQLPSCLRWVKPWTEGLLWKGEGFIERKGWRWHQGDFCRLRLIGGAKRAMGLFRGRSDICIIFKFYECKHLCGVFEYQLKTCLTLCIGDILLKQLKIV